MTQLEWFRILAPEFASTPDATVNAQLAAAALFVNVGCLDTDRANAAAALYAAHMMWAAANAGSGASGAIKSEREGDLSRTFGSIKGDDSWLGQSPYGLQYLDITAVCFGSGLMTRYGNDIPQGRDIVFNSNDVYNPVYNGGGGG